MFVVKTPRGLEYTAANLIKEKNEKAEIEIRPGGYLGLLVVKGVKKEDLEKIPEIERIIPVIAECKTNLEDIISKAEEIIEKIARWIVYGELQGTVG